MIHDENPTQITVITDKNAHTKTEDAFTTAVSKNLFSCRVMAFFIIRFRFHLFSGWFLRAVFGAVFGALVSIYGKRLCVPGKCAGEIFLLHGISVFLLHGTLPEIFISRSFYIIHNILYNLIDLLSTKKHRACEKNGERQQKKAIFAPDRKFAVKI